MKISLFQGILLGVFGVAALLGLFVFATYSNSGSGSASAVGKVVIWGTLPSADINTALTAATRIDSSLKDVSYVAMSEDAFKSNLTAAIATGGAPDLVLISQEQLAVLASVIQPIAPATLSAKSFQSAFTTESELYQAPGATGTYGIPFLIDPLVLYVNEPLLSSNGVAQPPTTWEALTGLVPKITETGTNGSISRSLAALGTYGNVHDARAILSALFLQTGVPLSVRTSTGALASDLGESESVGGVPAGEAVLRFYTQFADSSKVSYTWNPSLPDSEQAFVNGDLALYIGYASEARYIAQANPNLIFTVTALPQPATATVKATYGLDYAFAVPRGATNPSGAYQAAATLSGSAEQAVASVATGLAPAARAALASPPGDPTLATAYASALYAKGWLSPAPTDTDTVFSGMISSVASGRSTLSTALTAAQQALNGLLQ